MLNSRVIIRQKEAEGSKPWYAPQRSAVAPLHCDNIGDNGEIIVTDATGMPFMIPYGGHIEITREVPDVQGSLG